jgi:hypothetical protein
MDRASQALLIATRLPGDEQVTSTACRLNHQPVRGRREASPEDFDERRTVLAHRIIHRDQRDGRWREGVAGVEIGVGDLVVADKRAVGAVLVVDPDLVGAAFQQAMRRR